MSERKEYRLIWKRKGLDPKYKKWAHKSAMERFKKFLTAPIGESFDEPDAYMCCRGGWENQCGCGGLTWREHAIERMKDVPPLEWVRVEERTVGKWEQVAQFSKEAK